MVKSAVMVECGGESGGEREQSRENGSGNGKEGFGENREGSRRKIEREQL